MRSITIFCSGILALALLSAPAQADSTTNTVFVVFDFGGFDSTSGDFESFSYSDNSDLLFVNIASIDGTIEDFLGLTFNSFGFEGSLDGVPYFMLGHILGSDHLVLSSDGTPLPGTFDEMAAIGGVMNIGLLDPDLTMGGGSAFVGPGAFAGHFGNGIGAFTQGGVADVLSVGGDDGDLFGFTDPVFLASFRLDFVNGQIVGTQVPEPGLSLLALVGLAGAVIARRRRRAS